MAITSNLRNPAKWLLDLFGGGDEVAVTEHSILASPAIWYAMQTISGDVAKMPLEVRKDEPDGGHEIYKRHPAYKLLTQQPNDWQSADLFKEQLTSHALGWGNGRAAIVRSGGRPTELIPMLPDRTFTCMVLGEKYHVSMPDVDDPILFAQLIEEQGVEGLYDNESTVVMHDSEVLHIIGFGYNGYYGLSVAQVLREAIGIDLTAQKYSLNGMAKGFAGEVMLEAPPGLFRGEDEAAEFLNHFKKRHARGADGESVGLLREGVKANVMNMSPSDSQFLEQREFSRQDIMLIFGLQHMPGDDTSSSYNSLEQKQLSYLASCLDRWLVRWESQCDMKLRSEPEKRSNSVYFKFDRATWLRTDTLTKQEFLSGLMSSTVINRNEARAMIDMNPVEGGDEFLNPFTSSELADDEGGDEEVSEESTEESEEAGDVLIEDRIRYLTSLESSRVVELSERKDFLDQLESFYTKWAITLLNNSIPADRVRDITSDHRECILEIAGSVKSMDELKPEVEKLTRTWNSGSDTDVGTKT